MRSPAPPEDTWRVADWDGLTDADSMRSPAPPEDTWRVADWDDLSHGDA